MRRVPPEKNYTREQLVSKVRFVRRLANLGTGVFFGKKRMGQELYLETTAGRVRVLAYGLERPEKLPLFVNMHGGGFVLGNAEMDDPHLMNVAHKANVKILNVDYSLAPEAPFPKALEECYAVVKYAKEHAGELGIDPERIAVGGHSAGGNLSAAICLLDAERKELGIKCLILDYPPLDLHTDPYLKPRPKGTYLHPRLCRVFDASYCMEKEERKNPLVSPLYASLEQLKTFPPTLIITASQDSLCQEGEAFRDRLLQAGVDVTHKRFEGSKHGFTMTNRPDSMEGWQMIIDHLKRYLHD
ncbi:MAG: alpha/beta hydrolase [Firmicutes bacterium]|nr:alpha/beta hydrolase [Bacillota bacterium]HPU01007.1 alpha/beta hydrolase [Bacillota bacterium]